MLDSWSSRVSDNRLKYFSPYYIYFDHTWFTWTFLITSLWQAYFPYSISCDKWQFYSPVVNHSSCGPCFTVCSSNAIRSVHRHISCNETFRIDIPPKNTKTFYFSQPVFDLTNDMVLYQSTSWRALSCSVDPQLVFNTVEKCILPRSNWTSEKNE